MRKMSLVEIQKRGCLDCDVELNYENCSALSRKDKRLYVCNECLSKRQRKWFIENRDRAYKNNKKYKRDLRIKVFELLGGFKCSNPDCPISPEKMNPFCLTLEHPNNDGRIIRKIIGAGALEYLYYLKNPEWTKKNVRIFCIYCNWKRREKRVS